MNKKVFKISGMHCVSCARNIEKEIKKNPKVFSVRVDFAGEKMFVEGENFSTEDIKNKVEDLGYKSFQENMLKKEEISKSELEEKKRIKDTKAKAIWALILSTPLMVTMVLMYLDRMFFGQLWLEAILAFIVVYVLFWVGVCMFQLFVQSKNFMLIWVF